MEPWFFVVLLALGVPIAFMIWLIVRAVQTRDRIEELSRRVSGLEAEIYYRLKSRLAERAPTETKSQPVETAAEERYQHIATPPPVPEKKIVPPPIISEPLRPAARPASAKFFESESTSAAQNAPAIPPPIPANQESQSGRPAGKSAPSINWEQFMGVKGLMWVGGFALFLGVAFFVKYSFDHNLIPPVLRVAIGFAIGLALLAGGVILHRRARYIVGAQSLCATGVVILYAVTFACRSMYKFELFGPVPTFLLMALITATAFLLAARLNALVVAILGMLGGFLTPFLISTGQDNPSGLFGYIAILDTGLILVALNRRWFFLGALGAIGTALMQIAWAGKFFEAEKYFEGDKILVAFAVLLGFNLLFLTANWLAKRREKTDWWLAGSALGLVAVTLAFVFWFLDFPTLAQRPWLMFGFVFLVDAVVAALAWFDKKTAPALTVAGLAIFGLLGFWTQNSLTGQLLNPALVFYLVFAAAHSAAPALSGRQGGKSAPANAGQIFPILALALALVPVFKLAELSFIVWPFILLVDVLAIFIAAVTASLLPVLAVLVLTLGATAALIFKIPADLTGLPTSFFLVGAFAVFFVAASVWLVRKFAPEAFKSGLRTGQDPANPADVAAMLPACSATLPFLLLIMATLRLPLANPSPVFGVALLLDVLLLGLTFVFSLDWMPAVGLACTAALECAWHFNRFDPADSSQPPDLVLFWYVIFYAIFTVFPFLFRKKFADKTAPSAAAALAGLPQFLLIYKFVGAVHPNEFMGLLPAAFSIPPLLSLAAVLKMIPAENRARLSQLAWFGGIALFFITAIFPVQFKHEWTTIGWSLEGAALLWLFHRVPHRELQLTGFGLLIAAFVRLVFNPAVLAYHPRSTCPLWNWYLYSYGIVTVCLFAGAKLLGPPRNIILRVNSPPVLVSLGTLLAFLLLNIEIADYFSEPGAALTFEFDGNFARDMTYSIAWALFALALLVIGMVRHLRPARFSAMALLGVTLLKLFFHDLASLGQLYRIGAFLGVAVIAIAASFAYQRFYSEGEKTRPPAL